MLKELLSIPEFCDATGLGRTRTYQLINDGELIAIKVGRRTFIKRDDLNAWLLTLENYPLRELHKETSNVG